MLPAASISTGRTLWLKYRAGAEGSKTPAAKSIPVTVHKESDGIVVPAMAAE